MSGAGPDQEGTPGGRILVVDDNADNLEIISTRLRFRGYDIQEATRGEEALEEVRSWGPDLILLDVMLPDIDGYEVAQRIKEDSELPFIPIILVTARDSTQDKVAGLDAGADDYLTKPINFPELEARVRSMMRIKELQDEIGEKNERLEKLSISDGLTGLFNHRHIQIVLHEEFERAKRTGEPVTIIMFDLDHFKQVNDTYGHQVGDRVLRESAGILRGSAREIDKLGRYGGEEFIAILPGTDMGEGCIFAERVRRRLESHAFPLGDHPPIHMTISAGITTFPAHAASEPADLVRRADEALYSAKTAGRNRVFRSGTRQKAGGDDRSMLDARRTGPED